MVLRRSRVCRSMQWAHPLICETRRKTRWTSSSGRLVLWVTYWCSPNKALAPSGATSYQSQAGEFGHVKSSVIVTPLIGACGFDETSARRCDIGRTEKGGLSHRRTRHRHRGDLACGSPPLSRDQRTADFEPERGAPHASWPAPDAGLSPARPRMSSRTPGSAGRAWTRTWKSRPPTSRASSAGCVWIA